MVKHLIGQRLIDLQGLHLSHGLAVALLAPILADDLALTISAHRSDLRLKDHVVVSIV